MHTVTGLSIILLSSIAWGIGGIVGNGGDAIFCQASTENALSGYYSLDFVINGSWNSMDESYESKHADLIRLLNKTYPVLGKSLDDFFAHLLKQDLDQPRTWKPFQTGLIQLNDQNLISLVPENCRSKDNATNIYQAIVREQRPNQTVYNYDVELLNELKKQPLQLSYLLLHEWLWDFTDNVSIIRDANEILHTRLWNADTVDENVRSLNAIGLFKTTPERIDSLEISFSNHLFSMKYDDKTIIPDDLSHLYQITRPKPLYSRQKINVHLKSDVGQPIGIYPSKSFEDPISDAVKPVCSTSSNQWEIDCELYLPLFHKQESYKLIVMDQFHEISEVSGMRFDYNAN